MRYPWIVAAMNGGLSVTSDPGAGTSVRVDRCASGLRRPKAARRGVRAGSTPPHGAQRCSSGQRSDSASGTLKSAPGSS